MAEEEAHHPPAVPASRNNNTGRQHEQQQRDQDEEPLSDEVLRKLLKPTPTMADAADVVRASFCPTPETDVVDVVAQLDSYDDANFKVCINARPYLLKFHNGVESADFLRTLLDASGDYYRPGHAKSVIHLQNAMLWTLQEHGIPTSAPVPPVGSSSTTHHDGTNGHDNGGDKNNNDASTSSSFLSSSPVSIHTIAVADLTRSPARLVVRLYEWINGRPLSTVPVVAIETLAEVGQMLGRVHTALDPLSRIDAYTQRLVRAESYLLERRQSQQQQQLLLQSSSSLAAGAGGDGDPSSSAAADRQRRQRHLQDASLLVAARRFHQWDGKHTKELRAFLSYIKIAKRREMVESILTAFDVTIVQTGRAQKFRKGINHGDFNDANIMVEGEKISGVLDFGDSVESWRILDASTAMAYAMLSTYGKANRSISAAAALIRGYNAVYPITDMEREHLVLLIACRLACSCTLGAFSYSQNPANKYLLLHSEPAWRALELIWGYDAERREDMTTAINHIFHQACLYTDATGDVIGCSDLAMPDPAIPDLLQSVRLPSIFNTAASAESRPSKRRRSSIRVQIPSKPTITFVTGNAKKLAEVKRILGMEGTESSFPFVLVNKSMDLPDLQGEALNVAREKCYTAAEQLKGAVIVEDTSLCFNALNGMPGVFIKWFLDSCGLEGLNKMLVGYDNKSAYAQTIVAFSPGPGHDPVMFEGRTTGKIVPPRFGDGDHEAFGWDPIFEPDDGDGGLTYAEMSKAAKDAISHRSRAFTSIRQYLERNMEQVVAKLKAASEG